MDEKMKKPLILVTTSVILLTSCTFNNKTLKQG